MAISFGINTVTLPIIRIIVIFIIFGHISGESIGILHLIGFHIIIIIIFIPTPILIPTIIIIFIYAIIIPLLITSTLPSVRGAGWVGDKWFEF